MRESSGLIGDYSRDLSNSLGKGKVDIVSESSSADFTLKMNKITYQERDIALPTPRDDFHSVGLSTEFVLLDQNDTIIKRFIVRKELSDRRVRNTNEDGTANYSNVYVDIGALKEVNVEPARKRVVKAIRKHR